MHVSNETFFVSLLFEKRIKNIENKNIEIIEREVKK